MAGYKDPPKEHRFSKDNQPPNENKRVPKWRKRLREFVENELDEMVIAQVEQAKKGNVMAFKELLDRTYGKDPDKVINMNKEVNDMTEDEINKELERLEKLEKQNDTGGDK
jgi:hypothetical protein